MRKEQLAAYLLIFHCGATYAVLSPGLERVFGVKGKELREAVNALRREGVPICSNAGGYFYAETEEEIRGTLRHMTNRIAGITGAIRGLRRSLGNYEALRAPTEEGDDF